jgi:hypothetical protein
MRVAANYMLNVPSNIIQKQNMQNMRSDDNGDCGAFLRAAIDAA